MRTACLNGDFQRVCQLIEGDEDINAKDYLLRTPLHWASIGGHLEIVALLLDHGAGINCVNKFGYTPLYYACCHSHFEVASLLLGKEAKINIVDKDGNTAVHVAASATGNRRLLEMLFFSGADFLTKNNDGAIPLDLAVTYGNPTNQEILFLENLTYYQMYKEPWLVFYHSYKNHFDQSHMVTKLLNTSDLVRYITNYM